MDLSAFDYTLPPGLIAQRPPEARDGGRLLRIDRATRGLADHRVRDLPDLLAPGDCLVVNDTRVIPARVLARASPGEAPVELLFVEAQSPARWRAMVRPGRRCRPGTNLLAGGEEAARLRIVDAAPDGTRIVERLDGTIDDLLARHGLPPLPPYIARHGKPAGEDWDRYQTVYARHAGSVAAPTAGLHLTPELLGRLRARGVEVHAVTLHVGPGTFRPVRVRDVAAHAVPPERAEIAEAVAAAVNTARREGRRVVAVGTTTTRALESAVDAEGRVRAHHGPAAVTIGPGHRFQIVGALVTNFHLPRSSLLIMTAAFAGRELLLEAYAHAIRAGYRFYSYGDATLIT